MYFTQYLSRLTMPSKKKKHQLTISDKICCSSIYRIMTIHYEQNRLKKWQISCTYIFPDYSPTLIRNWKAVFAKVFALAKCFKFFYILCNMKTQSCFFCFSFHATLFFSQMNALVYVNIDHQDIH